MDQYQNVRAKTIKFLEENLSINYYDLEFGKGFLDMTPNAWVTEEKNTLLGLYQNKKNYVSKDIIKKVKKIIHKMGENICKSYIW